MIALVILGLGLLFIAAALPVGLEYTRQTVDLATGEATADYALEQFELTLRSAGNNLYDPTLAAALPPGSPIRLDDVHRPRNTSATPPLYPLNPTYEPFIKVRPLVVGNLRMGNVTAGTRAIVDDVESTIGTYVSAVGLAVGPLETDFNMGALTGLSLGENHVFPGLARVYPPIEPVTTFSVNGFFNGDPELDRGYPSYGPRFATPQFTGSLSVAQQQREQQKALDRRLAWTAFYRRLSYQPDPGTDGTVGTPDDLSLDPLRYEIILVVTRRPSANHRFPRQDLATGSGFVPFETPSAWSPATPPGDDATVGTDRAAPMPWLVTFDSANPQALPTLATTQYVRTGTAPNFQRVLVASFPGDPPTLTFRCAAPAPGQVGVGDLLPVGSFFIPAVNDQRYLPAPPNPPQAVGFVPSTTEALPIYEVVERPDDTTVIVKNNGHYPWLAAGLDASRWPVWVIPPSFVERDSDNRPVLDQKSPIIQIVRRTVTLREVAP